MNYSKTKKMKKQFLFGIWVVLTLLLSVSITELATISNTLCNILSLILFIVYIIVSIKTECLTNLKFLKNEKK